MVMYNLFISRLILVQALYMSTEDSIKHLRRLFNIAVMWIILIPTVSLTPYYFLIPNIVGAKHFFETVAKSISHVVNLELIVQ